MEKKIKYLYILAVCELVWVRLPHDIKNNIYCALKNEILQVFGILKFQLFKNVGYYEVNLLG